MKIVKDMVLRLHLTWLDVDVFIQCVQVTIARLFFFTLPTLKLKFISFMFYFNYILMCKRISLRLT